MVQRITNYFTALGKAIKNWFIKLGKNTKSFFVNLPRNTKNFFISLYQIIKHYLITSQYPVYLSALIMGFGQIFNKQYIKATLYFLVEVGFILFMVFLGGDYISGLITLGVNQADPILGIQGDNSIALMLMGLVSVVIICIFVYLYISNIKDCYKTRNVILNGKKPNTFVQGLKDLLDKNFYKTVLAIPLIGVSVFSVVPIIFMILIAFTNYSSQLEPPTDLIDWAGFESFQTIFSAGNISDTFFKILGWNILWAILTTIINYFIGLGLALLLNSKKLKGRIFFRAFPILAYAIPGFITMLAFKFMFSNGGPINYYIKLFGGSAIDFLGIDSTWGARFIGLFVNAWVSTPSIMLLATGILSNLNTDLYEAASIDGASKFRQFYKITLPFVVFSTTPVIISQFISNFNNFGVFYFLRGSIYSPGYFVASDTDLLINWLYRLSINQQNYNIGGAISILVFIITSIISLLVYVRSPAYRKEDTYR